ncbi:MAG: prephenate dehydratase domain-containing protein [Gemmatimonadota bacterium]
MSRGPSMVSPAAAPLGVAVQGELGSNSELAAREYFPDAELAIVPCPSFAALFDAVAEGRAAYGMAPVENSLAGSVHEVWDLLAARRPAIAGEILLRINHCLISHRGARLSEVADVYSHPQALAQCQAFLGKMQDVRQHPFYDTAGAVKMVAARGVRGEAAIASAQAAADYGMEILAGDIETQTENFTRFLVLAAAPVAPGAAAGTDIHTAVVAEMGERGRRLPELVAPLVSRGLEITKVECSKRLGTPWTYVAYIEFAGAAADPAVWEALVEMGRVAAPLTVVGTYRAGRRATPRLHHRLPPG